jgi:N-acetylmuramoyl-L-alanine amidase
VVKLNPISTITNGVKNFNSKSIHIAYQGGVDRANVSKAVDTRTEAQKAAILDVIFEVLEELKPLQDISGIKIMGHRDISPDKNLNGLVDPWERIKECPSFDAIPEYGWITAQSA